MIALDTVSSSNGLADGVTFCGSRSISISPSSYTFLDFTSATLTLLSTDFTEATSPITITISATIDNYPSVIATQKFTVLISVSSD